MGVDVGVHCSGGNFVWTFPGTDGELARALEAGHFPAHLLEGWTPPPIQFEGTICEVERAPLLDRLLEIERGSTSGITAKLYLMDDEHVWQGSREDLPTGSAWATERRILDGLLDGYEAACRFRATPNRKVTFLAPTAELPEAVLVAVLDHPATEPLETLDLSGLPAVPSAVVAALVGRRRRGLQYLTWPGDLDDTAAQVLESSELRFDTLTVEGRLGGWITSRMIRAAGFPTGSPRPRTTLWTSDPNVFVAGLFRGLPILLGGAGIQDGFVDAFIAAGLDGLETIQIPAVELSRDGWARLARHLGTCAGLRVLDVRLALHSVDDVITLATELPPGCTLLRGVIDPEGRATFRTAVELDDEPDDSRLQRFLWRVVTCWIDALAALARLVGVDPTEFDLLRGQVVVAPVGSVIDRVQRALRVFDVPTRTRAAAGSTAEGLEAVVQHADIADPLAGRRRPHADDIERGNDVSNLASWVVATGGMVRAWRGDGHDVPTWDDALAAALQAEWETIATRRWRKSPEP